MNILLPLVELEREPQGYIQPGALSELWFHTGTACNLACPFCFEGSKPGDGRLERITLVDAQPLIDEAVSLGARQFSFTGGEPFIVKDFVNILRYASNSNPCLVLTNGTDPLLKRLRQIEPLLSQPHSVSFRVSIDYPDGERHDASRGRGSFEKSWRSLSELHARGFRISVARQKDVGEDSQEVDASYRSHLRQHSLPEDMRIVAFPEFLTPGANPLSPVITERCMTSYHTAESRQDFMCYFSKMVVKKNGRMRVYACTLVDDDESFDLGADLAEAIGKRVYLRHHRCHACFSTGASCSEM